MRWMWTASLLAITACSRPPEAPRGLDDSLRHLLHGFYQTDEDVRTGLIGLVDWYETEGAELVGTTADIDNIGAFELEPLDGLDLRGVQPLPASDPLDAPGVVAVAELPCGWRRAEGLLVRPDQSTVFPDFDFYNRHYQTDRAAFEAARAAGEYPRVDAPITDPMSADPSVFLATENSTSGTEMGVTITFDLHMHARHGLYDLDNGPTQASLFLTWMPERSEAPGGANTMEQSYTLESYVDDGHRTLWVYASWAEVHTTLFAPDSPAMLAISANTARATGERMGDICTGRVALD